jgi:hypothetical protein
MIIKVAANKEDAESRNEVITFYVNHHMTWLAFMEYLSLHFHGYDLFVKKHNPALSSFINYQLILDKINTRDLTSVAGTDYPSRITSLFLWGSCFSIFSFLWRFVDH